MTRLPTPMEPGDGPLEEFALGLRSLRDQMGAHAPGVDEISAREHIPRSTLYAALRGDRLPRREVVAAFARSWGADEIEWLSKRSAVESNLRLGHNTLRPLLTSHQGQPFSSLTQEALELLRNAGSSKRYAARTDLLREGDIAISVLLIDRGLAKVAVTTEGGQSVLLGMRGPGDLLGEIGAISGQPRSATVTSETEIEVTVLPAERFIDLLAEHPKLAIEISSIVHDRLSQADRRIAQTATLAPHQRLLRMLSDLGAKFGRTLPDGSVDIPFTFTQAELAGLIGASEKTTAKALIMLRNAGVLQTSYRKIRVLAPG